MKLSIVLNYKGSGTEEDPYICTDEDQLSSLTYLCKYLSDNNRSSFWLVYEDRNNQNPQHSLYYVYNSGIHWRYNVIVLGNFKHTGILTNYFNHDIYGSLIVED
jgi:hypothetical protein